MKNIAFAYWLVVSATVVSAAGVAGKLPLAFEPNQGQGSADSRFLARGPGYTVSLRSDGVSILTQSTSRKPVLTVMRLVGGTASAVPIAEQMLPGKVNYFLGSDSRKWHRDLPTYGRVQFRQAYPGIDLLYYGSEGRLEYDFVVQPGSNPALIRMAFSGASRPRISPNGDLEIGEVGSRR